MKISYEWIVNSAMLLILIIGDDGELFLAISLNRIVYFHANLNSLRLIV